MIPLDENVARAIKGPGFVVILESRPDIHGPVKYSLITNEGKPFEIRQEAEKMANKASCRLDALDAWVIETKNVVGYSSMPA